MSRSAASRCTWQTVTTYAGSMGALGRFDVGREWTSGRRRCAAGPDRQRCVAAPAPIREQVHNREAGSPQERVTAGEPTVCRKTYQEPAAVEFDVVLTLLLPGRSRQGRWHRTPPPAEPWHGCIVSRDHPLEPAGPRQVPRAFVGGAHADLGDRSRGSRGQGQTRDLHGRARPGGSDTLRFMPIGRRRTRQSLGSGAIDLKLEVETSLELRPHGPGARDAAKANWPSVSVSMLDPGEDY
jgi:hypothetical protein